ncbi:ABC transporter ATP-binding protein/permease [Methylobacterium sp. J-001]|uniref:ABC transporter ATP-binding protein n=1 Tax=Methylobacterium sp. J-001 TaxID=2836609 RepID=UPI001FB8CD7A|nr:ABC transporter ATP-binding protein [Methylobacterium sp. J-001]MCJ2117575.1 ABC transporter ATP-binding protein/permease [Methylobacterium sp. J-001]
MLKAFLAYYRPHRALFLMDFGCAVLSGLLELGFPIAVKTFVDRLLPQQDWGLIVLAACGLALVYVANAGLMVVVTYWGHVLGINIETTMRARAFDHLQKLSFRFYDGQKTGHLVARVTKDLEEIGEVAHHGPEDLFIAVMTLIGAFALMVWVHPTLALITGAILPVIAFVSLRYGGRLTRNWQTQYGRVGAFNARIEENVGGMRVVQAFANEQHERTLFARDNARYRDTKLEAYRLMAASLSINYLGLRLVQIAVLLGGAAFVVRGDLTAGGFVGFLLLVGVFYRPLEKISAVIETYPKGVAGFRRYQELLATAPDIVDRPDAIETRTLRGDIRFEGVRFGYDRGRPILAGLDLAIAAGETVAFVGPSGVGKTTLCALLPRFYEVEAGRVTIDGIDVRALSLSALRRQIGIVQQDVFLFAGTIRENIAYGRLDATEAEIDQAARRARLGELIDSLPEGLDTVVGERGVRLSGGQKQRIAIARVFLKNPPILILDEATSALDTQTEREIQQALTDLARGRTTLIIAHRLATIRDADRIVVLGEDGIVEQGRHAALLDADGVYRRLHAAQFGSTGQDEVSATAAE